MQLYIHISTFVCLLYMSICVFIQQQCTVYEQFVCFIIPYIYNRRHICGAITLHLLYEHNCVLNVTFTHRHPLLFLVNLVLTAVKIQCPVVTLAMRCLYTGPCSGISEVFLASVRMLCPACTSTVSSSCTGIRYRIGSSAIGISQDTRTSVNTGHV